MGARPFASLNSLRFGRPDHPRTPSLLRGVVSGIGGYGNSFGVPTVGGEVNFHPRYNGNILVNAFTVGVAETKGLFFGTASGVGNPVLYVGSKTGRDGIHGATFSSLELTHESETVSSGAVQIGDPITERKAMDAVLRMRDEELFTAITDCGAGGFSSAVAPSVIAAAAPPDATPGEPARWTPLGSSS